MKSERSQLFIKHYYVHVLAGVDQHVADLPVHPSIRPPPALLASILILVNSVSLLTPENFVATLMRPEPSVAGKPKVRLKVWLKVNKGDHPGRRTSNLS
eukprot:756879-Hanusia_phi.AAC.4